MDRICAQCRALTCQSKQKKEKGTDTMFASTKHDQASSMKQFMSGSHHPKRKEERHHGPDPIYGTSLYQSSSSSLFLDRSRFLNFAMHVYFCCTATSKVRRMLDCWSVYFRLIVPKLFVTPSDQETSS